MARRKQPDRTVLHQIFKDAKLDDFLDRQTVAAGLNICPGTLFNLCKKNIGPEFSKIGKCCLYKKGDVLEWLSTKKVTQQAPRTFIT